MSSTNIRVEDFGVRRNSIGVTIHVNAWSLLIGNNIVEEIFILTNKLIQKGYYSY